MACLYIQHVALERENVISSFTVQGVKSTGDEDSVLWRELKAGVSEPKSPSSTRSTKRSMHSVKFSVSGILAKITRIHT